MKNGGDAHQSKYKRGQWFSYDHLEYINDHAALFRLEHIFEYLYLYL